MPYLSEVEQDERANVELAVDLLSLLRGTQRVGLEKISYKELTAREFELVSYLSAQIDSHGSKGK